MANPPISILPSGGYVPPVNGVAIPYTGQDKVEMISDQATGALDFSTLIVTVDMDAEFPVVENPEPQVPLWGRLRYPQAALHVVGLRFVISAGNFGPPEIYRFY